MRATALQSFGTTYMLPSLNRYEEVNHGSPLWFRQQVSNG